MTTTRDLVCPKCSGRMGSYERSGIVVDQCQDCRGIFLDKGELERMVDTEGGGWSGMVGRAVRSAWAATPGVPETTRVMGVKS